MIELRITSSDYVYLDFEKDWDIINDVKKIPGRSFIKKKEQWKFKLTKHNISDFLEFCSNWSVDIPSSIEKRMKEIVEKAKQFEKRKKENKKIVQKEDSDIEVKGLARGMDLYSYQRVAVEFTTKNKNVIIGDQPGLGKTIESIASVHKMDAYPCLVVCPSTVKWNWQNEWNMWLPRKTCKVYEPGDSLDLRSRVTIINYANVWKHRKKLKKNGYKSMILDESHFCKNGSAKRSKAVKYIAKGVSGPKILLSGTAVVNRPKELINQLKIIDVFKQEFGDFYSYTTRFCDGKQTKWGWDATGASNTKELNERLKASCYIRRNKRDVLKDLPDKQFQRIDLELSASNLKDYKKIERKYADMNSFGSAGSYSENINPVDSLNKVNDFVKKSHEAFQDHQNENAAELAAIAKLRAEAAKAKFTKVKKWVSEFLETGEKLLLFGYHRSLVQGLADEFDCPSISGATDSKDKQRIVDEFQNGEHQMLSMNYVAAGVGITLTEASDVAFAELPWTPGEVEQASDRAHRVGQKNAVNIYYLLGMETIDMDVFELVEEKRKITEQINAGRDITDDTGNIVKDVVKKIKNRNS